MSGTRKSLVFIAGALLGALAGWGLAIAYEAVIDTDRGSLTLPFLLVTSVGLVTAIMRPELRSASIGIIAGAAAETAFFLWLFKEWSLG